MKLIITGRRRDGQTWAQMKAHMLEVHGPLVHREVAAIRRYVQNHIRDGVYGPDGLYGRDMVAEITVDEGAPPAAPSAAVIADESNFAHLDDRFRMLGRETVVLAPPSPPKRDEPPRGFKALTYLKRRGDLTPEAFAEAWAALDAQVLRLPGLTGYVRTATFAPPGAPAPAYDAIASAWFADGQGEAGFAAFKALLDTAAIHDPDAGFSLFSEEHLIIGG